MNAPVAFARTLPDKDVLASKPRGPVMVVDLDAIATNFRFLASKTTGMAAAIVKGDGYGHGMLPSALALARVGAKLFFVARLDDAFTLRAALPEECVVSALDGADRFSIAETIAARIVPFINGPEQLAAVVKAANRQGALLRAFVHIDTAMNRLGFTPSELGECAEALRLLDIQAYMTHFAAADDMDIGLCRRQVAALKHAVRKLPSAPLSIANSCGVFLGREFHGDIIRPGKSTFGINPLPEGRNPMAEPAQVWAPVVQLRQVERGEAVGYSSTWRAPERRKVAVLAIGYSAGYRRSASNRGYVAFEGHRAKVIGRVSMDLTAVDVSDLPESIVGEGVMAEIAGPTITYRELAQSEETNEHEALIALGAGCKRIHRTAHCG